MVSGIHSSCSRPGNWKSGPITPTTSYSVPLKLMVRPTIAGSPPNRRRHKPSPRSTTRSLPICSSCAVKPRPSAGVTRSTGNRLEERRPASSRSGSPDPTRLKFCGALPSAASSNTRLRVAPFPVVGRIDPRPRTGIRQARPDRHQPLRLSVRERPQHHPVDDAENRGGGADAQRHDQRADRRERRRPAQQSHAEAQIATELVQERPGPGRAGLLADRPRGCRPSDARHASPRLETCRR